MEKEDKFDATGKMIEFSEKFWCIYMPFYLLLFTICVFLLLIK